MIADGPVAVPLSARSAKALVAQAGQIGTHLANTPGARVVDLAWSLATSRSGLEHRAVLLAADTAELAAGLTALGTGGPDPAGLVTGIARPDRLAAALFTGQGAQRLGMGRQLHAVHPVFAEAFDETLAELDRHLDRPLRDVVWGTDEDLLRQTRYAQAGTFAVEVALFRLLSAWGLRPAFLAGHSVGELTAAHLAGVLDLADAALLIAARGRLMQALPAGGAMTAVAAAESEVMPLLTAGVGIAAVNGPHAVVVSGRADEVDAIAAELGRRGRRTSPLRVSHAFHSPLMAPMLAEFREIAQSLDYQPPRLPVVSMLTGRQASEAELTDPEHWVRHVSEPVRFADGMDWLAAQGVDTFLEVGPDAALTPMATACLSDDAAVVPMLRRGRDEQRQALSAIGTAYTRGIAVRWPALLAHARQVDLPTYPFARDRFWIDAVSQTAPVAPKADSDWRYRIEWQPVSLTGTAPAPVGSWLLVLPEQGAESVAALIEGALPGVITVNAAGTDRAVLAEKLAGAGPLAGVLSLLALDVRPHPEFAWLSRGVADTVVLGQALADAEVAAPLWLITTGAVAVDGPAELTDPVQSAIWGLGLALSLDRPQAWGGLIDLPADADSAGDLVSILADAGHEDQLALRPNGVFVRRLVPAPSPISLSATTFAPTGSTLITGGTGGLGAHVARQLAAAGAPALVLVSRQGEAAPGAAELAAELGTSGTHVRVVACDVSDADALAGLLASVPDLTAVIHAAGASQRIADLGELSVAEFAEVGRAKVRGAQNLVELLADTELAAFVVFSSGSSIWGSGGQAAYAAANAQLTAIAATRRAAGKECTAISWGSWNGGMVDAELAAMLDRLGAPVMEPARALAELNRAMVEGAGELVVADFDWDRFAPTYTLARPRPLLNGVPAAAAAIRGEDGSAGTGALTATLTELTAPEQKRLVTELVGDNVSSLLGYSDVAELDPQRTFGDLGFDSVAAVDLGNRLKKATGRALPSTMTFDYPTPVALAEFLHGELCPGGEAATGGDAALAALDRLELVADGLDRDELLQTRLTARLQALIGRLGKAVAEPADDTLDGASRDDVLAFIDQQLGL